MTVGPHSTSLGSLLCLWGFKEDALHYSLCSLLCCPRNLSLLRFSIILEFWRGQGTQERSLLLNKDHWVHWQGESCSPGYQGELLENTLLSGVKVKSRRLRKNNWRYPNILLTPALGMRWHNHSHWETQVWPMARQLSIQGPHPALLCQWLTRWFWKPRSTGAGGFIESCQKWNTLIRINS